MKELLKANIKNSFRIVAEDKPKIPPELIQVVDEEPSHFPSLVEELMKVAAKPVPWFYRDKSNNLQSPQQAFFGFYALRNIIRGILLSVRFIQAGDLLHKNNFIASSVFSYDTASFHLLHSFLACYGRVIIDQVYGGPVKVIKRKNSSEGLYCSLDPTPEVLVAILTKTNKWKFEPRPRSHARRWKELEHVFKELDFDIPEFFCSFFKYILSYGSYSPTESKIFIQDGLKRLADIRHESIYSGYGFDDRVHDALTNRDLDTSYGIDLKATKYRAFAFGFPVHAVDDVMEIKNLISDDRWSEVRPLMATSIYTPPFELIDLKLKDSKTLNKKLQMIFIWLIDRKLQGERMGN